MYGFDTKSRASFILVANVLRGRKFSWVEPTRRRPARGGRAARHGPPCGTATAFQAQGTTATIFPGMSATAPAHRWVGRQKWTATNLGTNLAQSAPNGRAMGSYFAAVSLLPVGNYKVEISSTGFKKFDQTGITLDVNRKCAGWMRLLQVGAITESVEVSARMREWWRHRFRGLARPRRIRRSTTFRW